MHKKDKTKLFEFALFELSSINIMMMMMEIKHVSIGHDENDDKQAGCFIIKILYRYNAFLEKWKKIKKGTNLSH